jgi:hypothetical protein
VRQCRATTRLGNRCNKPALPGSLACSIDKHIEQVEKDYRILQWGIMSWYRIPIWKKLVAFLGFLLSISLAIYYGEKSLSKSDLRGSEERIINIITKAEKINRARLENEYPYGYVLLHVDNETLKPIKREAVDLYSKKCEIDWSKSRVIRLGKKGVDILLPDLVVCTPKGRTEFSRNNIHIKRRTGVKQGDIATIEEVTFWVEVLIDDENLLALVIGFGPEI